MFLISRVIATGFFVGYTPFFPGTVGSLLGLFLYWIIPGSESIYFILVIITLFFTGVWSARQVEIRTGTEDNQIIVVDEIVGMLVTVSLFEKHIVWLVAGFLLFRVFDIVKPFPAKRSEGLQKGWGVMADDIVAGIYAAVCLRIINKLLGNADLLGG